MPNAILQRSYFCGGEEFKILLQFINCLMYDYNNKPPKKFFETGVK